MLKYLSDSLLTRIIAVIQVNENSNLKCYSLIGDPSALTHSYVQDMIVQKHKTIICFLIIVGVENPARLLGS